jgi:hypothetical protein
MQFHNYVTYRRIVARSGAGIERETAKAVSSHQYRRQLLEDMAARNETDAQTFNEHSIAFAEEIWVASERPYYNVWPIAADLVESVKLDLKFSQVRVPFFSILLRFAVGREPSKLRTALIFWPRGFKTIQIFCHFQDGTDDVLTVQHAYELDDVVEDWLARLNEQAHNMREHHHEAGKLLVRLVVFLGLLAQNDDLVTPIVLSKDQSKYDLTNDEALKAWLENRAAKRAGRGFNFGRRLQIESEQSPHWRNPHLCLFWTGEGHKIPVIKMRSGAVVQKVSMAEVPTGYLGPETAIEDQITEKTPREAIPKSKRFEILKRDGYRCQLCGASQVDGATLHVDHKKPLARGGTYDDSNLWTLCDTCNLGKSARDL